MRGEKCSPEWMNARIRQCNLQHRDAPKKPIAFGPPQPMDSKIKKSPLITKEASIDDNIQHEELDIGDIELSNMLVSIKLWKKMFYAQD